MRIPSTSVAVGLLGTTLALGLAPLTLAANGGKKKEQSPAAPLTDRPQKPVPPPPKPLTASETTALADQLDVAIAASLKTAGMDFNRPATDEEFLRRIYLDIIGRVPTIGEARAFLDGKEADKRTQLIDRLLASPGRNMREFNWLADLLRVRDAYGKGAFSFLYQDWLKDQIAANTPWDRLVYSLVTAEGKLCESGPTGFILRDADMPLDGVSYMLTNFLGANVGCAQCHDHPMAEWTQRNFYEVAAFFGATDTRDERALGMGNRVLKLNETELDQRARLIVVNNATRIETTINQTLRLPNDYKYKDAKPGDKVAPHLLLWDANEAQTPLAKSVDTRYPSHLRGEFADWLTAKDNPRFAANIANREWKKVFGVALIEPVGDIDNLDKAANPALLAKATAIMKQVGFDRRQFERVLYHTRAYQSAASVNVALDGSYLFPGPILRRMTAEQAWDSTLALGVGDSVDTLVLRRGDLMHMASIPNNDMTLESLKAAVERVENSGIMPGKKGNVGAGQATRMLTQYQGGRPQFVLNPVDRKASLILARASETPQPAPESHFLRLFGQSERLISDSSTRDGSIPQALMMMNGPVSDIVTRPSALVIQEALKGRTAGEQIDTLYLGFFARHPSQAERDRGVAAVRDGLALADLAWTLLNAREFLFIN